MRGQDDSRGSMREGKVRGGRGAGNRDSSLIQVYSSTVVVARVRSTGTDKRQRPGRRMSG